MIRNPRTLLAAADLADAVATSMGDSWGRHSAFFSDNKPCCLLGHLSTVCQEGLLSMDAENCLRHVLYRLWGDNPMTSVNDNAANRWEMVERLHDAANHLRKEARS